MDLPSPFYLTGKQSKVRGGIRMAGMSQGGGGGLKCACACVSGNKLFEVG